MILDLIVKNIIPYIRRERGIKQNDMAKALGVTPSYLCKVERGVMDPSAEFVESCSKYLKTSSDILFPKKIDRKNIAKRTENCPNKLWSVRQKLGMKQTELARMLDCSPSYLSKVEKGHQSPPLDFCKKCAKILKVRESELFPANCCGKK